MSAASDAIAAATTDAANVGIDQTKLAADQATEATDEATAFNAITAAGGTGLYITYAPDGVTPTGYYLATAVPPGGFKLDALTVL